MRDFTRLLLSWSALCRVPLLAGIGLSALSVTGCRSQREVEKSWRCHDKQDEVLSTAYEVLTLEWPMSVAPDTASLKVPTELLLTLPEGAEYSRKTGRTRVSLRKDGDSILAVAETDSIGRTVSRYERRARDSLKRTVSTTTATKEETTEQLHKRNTWSLWLLAGIIVTIVALMVIRITLK